MAVLVTIGSFFAVSRCLQRSLTKVLAASACQAVPAQKGCCCRWTGSDCCRKHCIRHEQRLPSAARLLGPQRYPAGACLPFCRLLTQPCSNCAGMLDGPLSSIVPAKKSPSDSRVQR